MELKEDFLDNQKKRINDLKSTQNELTIRLNEFKNQKLQKEMAKQELDLKISDIAHESIIRVTLDLNNENDFNLLKLTRQQFKDKKLSKQHLEHIAYVDIEKKSNKIYIRCKSADSAKTIMKTSDFLVDLPNKKILTDKEEEEYLNRIMYGRNKYKVKKDKKQTNEKEKEIAQICNQNESSKKQVQKVDDKKILSKHIVFEEDDNE